jgi:hypothetical protein
MPEFLPESHRPLATLAAAFQAGVVKRVDREGLIFHHLFSVLSVSSAVNPYNLDPK